ncbi:unnamed protein product, partial [Symbiodinium microadriaticum]
MPASAPSALSASEFLGAASAGIPAERPEPWKMPDEAPSSAAGEFRDYGGRRGRQQQVAQVQEVQSWRRAAGSDAGASDGLGVGSELPAQLVLRVQVPDEELLTDQDMEGLDDYTVRRILRILAKGFEAGTVTTSLKATLWGILLMEWQLRLQKTGTDEKMLRIMENAGWAQRSPLQWCYTEWNPEQGKALPSRKDNLPHEEAKTALARLIKSTARTMWSQSLKPLKPDIQAEAIVMLLTLAVCHRAMEIYQDLDSRQPGKQQRGQAGRTETEAVRSEAAISLARGGQDVVMILQAHEDEMKSIKDLHADFRNRHGASDQHHANMQQRVDYLEKMMGDSADKHAAHVKQLEELRRSHDDMRNRHGASDQHHASVQQRVDYLEKMMGDSADKHAAQVKQLEELRRSHDDIRKKHGANDQYHASVQQRVDYLEKMLGDSADKHVAHVKQLEELRRSHDDAHGRHANVAQALKDKHASVEERLKFLEQAIGDSADRHSQELKQTKMQLEALHGKLSDEQGLREGRDKHHATLEERMRYLEQALGDSADKHSRELKAHKDGRDKQHASLEEKVKYIEKLIGDSADEHAKKLEAHKRDLEDHKRNLDDHKMQAQSQKATVERHASFEQRLDFLERALGDSAEHHTGQLRAAKAELEQKQQAHHAATGSLADRLQYLERWLVRRAAWFSTSSDWNWRSDIEVFTSGDFIGIGRDGCGGPIVTSLEPLAWAQMEEATTAVQLFSRIQRLRIGAAVVSSVDAALSSHLDAAARSNRTSSDGARRSGLCSRSHNGRAGPHQQAQLGQMLRHHRREQRSWLKAAWSAWKARSSWTQAMHLLQADLGRAEAKLQCWHRWRKAVQVARREDSRAAVMADLLAARERSQEALQESFRCRAEEKGLHLKRLENRLLRGQRHLLRLRSWRSWKKQAFVSRKAAISSRRKDSLCSAMQRQSDSAKLRAIQRAWCELAAICKQQRQDVACFVKFKTLHFCCEQKNFKEFVLLTWFLAMHRTQIRRQKLLHRHQQRLLRAMRSVSAQRSAALTQHCTLVRVLRSWRRATEEQTLLDHAASARRQEACHGLISIVRKLELSRATLACCLLQWSRLRVSERFDPGSALHEVSWVQKLRSCLEAEVEAEIEEKRRLQESILSTQRSEQLKRFETGACLLEILFQKQTAAAKHGSLRQWRLWSAGMEVAMLARHAEEQSSRLRDLEEEVRPMQRETRALRVLCANAILRRLRLWRLSFCREVLAIWACSTQKEARDVDREADALMRQVRNASPLLISSSVNALLGTKDVERLKHFVLEAWLKAAEDLRHLATLQELQEGTRLAESRLTEESAHARQRASKAVLAWITQQDVLGGSMPAEDVRAVLQGWALAVAEGLQSKLKHFRKQRAEVEITNLCLKTGEWLDHLMLCKALQYWQLAVLTQITWHRHSELELAERRVVRHAGGLRKVALVQSKSDDFRHNVSCSRVCFGAWARSAALLTAQKVIETARKQVERQQLTSMHMLSREKARLADTVFMSMTATFGARDASDSLSSGRFLVKRCFPWWRRQAAYMAAKQRVLRREASNLKLQEDMRRCGKAHQRRWASWAASSKLRRQHWQHVREAFQAWSQATSKPLEDPIDVHGRTLFSAELALSRQPFTGRVVFAAWRRISQEEKAMSLEKQTRELEAQLARAACEKALSVKQLEQRLAFQDDEGGQQVSFEFQALQTQKFEERLRSFNFGLVKSRSKPTAHLEVPKEVVVAVEAEKRGSILIYISLDAIGAFSPQYSPALIEVVDGRADALAATSLPKLEQGPEDRTNELEVLSNHVLAITPARPPSVAIPCYAYAELDLHTRCREDECAGLHGDLTVNDLGTDFMNRALDGRMSADADVPHGDVFKPQILIIRDDSAKLRLCIVRKASSRQLAQDYSTSIPANYAKLPMEFPG